MRQKPMFRSWPICFPSTFFLIVQSLSVVDSGCTKIAPISGWCFVWCWLEMVLVGAGANWLGPDAAASDFCWFLVVLAVDVDVNR